MEQVRSARARGARAAIGVVVVALMAPVGPSVAAPAAAAPSGVAAVVPARAATGAVPAGVPAIKKKKSVKLSRCSRESLRRVRLVRRGINVDRRCQRAYITKKGRIIRNWRATTGKPGYATRAGRWRIFRNVNRWEQSNIYRGAWMYRSMYFSGGQAVHGSSTDALVVPYPASHGCVRLKRAKIDWLWRKGYARVGKKVYVF